MNEGVLISGPIRPLNPDDDYPTALANEIKGGCHSYSSVENVQIPEERKEENMLISTANNIFQYNNAYLSNLVTNYLYIQEESLNLWVINHNLNRYPDALVLDDSGRKVECEIIYKDLDSLEIHSNKPFKGKVQLR